MLKGIMALFTSGLILNPFVLFGIISGAYVVLHFEPEGIRSLLSSSYLYMGVFVVSILYTFIFTRVYQEGGIKTDWFATFMKSVWNGVRYIVSFVLAMSFITMISIF